MDNATERGTRARCLDPLRGFVGGRPAHVLLPLLSLVAAWAGPARGGPHPSLLETLKEGESPSCSFPPIHHLHSPPPLLLLLFSR